MVLFDDFECARRHTRQSGQSRRRSSADRARRSRTSRSRCRRRTSRSSSSRAESRARRRERRRVEGRLEAHAHAHRRQRAARVAARVVARRRDVRLARARTGEAQRVVDVPLRHRLVVAHEAGEDRQTRGVGRRPARGRSAFEPRSKIAPDPAVQLVPPFTGCASNSSYSFHASTSTTSTWRSPDADGPPSIGASAGIGYGPGSLSSAVVERHRHLRLTRVHDDVRNSIRRAVVHRAEVRMEIPHAARRDQRRRLRIHLRAGDQPCSTDCHPGTGAARRATPRRSPVADCPDRFRQPCRSCPPRCTPRGTTPGEIGTREGVLAFGNAVAIRDARTVRLVTDRLSRIAYPTGSGTWFLFRSIRRIAWGAVRNRYCNDFAEGADFAEKAFCFLQKLFVVLCLCYVRATPPHPRNRCSLWS